MYIHGMKNLFCIGTEGEVESVWSLSSLLPCMGPRELEGRHAPIVSLNSFFFFSIFQRTYIVNLPPQGLEVLSFLFEESHNTVWPGQGDIRQLQVSL